ncbi:hypothetical protein ACX40Y_16375 [Sphingomonas sp. RS6]
MAGLLILGGCGGGETTNYSDPPPMAEIVATPAPTPTPDDADAADAADRNAAE